MLRSGRENEIRYASNELRGTAAGERKVRILPSGIDCGNRSSRPDETVTWKLRVVTGWPTRSLTQVAHIVT